MVCGVTYLGTIWRKEKVKENVRKYRNKYKM